MDKKRLLSSRRIGADRSKGDVVIFIDSDHVLEPTLLERTARFFQNTDIDMAILEEKGFNPKKIVQKMYNLDRKNIHEGLVINPFKGVLGSRIFKKDLMMKTFDKIDKKLDNIIVVQDHAIIYYEAWRISKKIGMIKNALFHIDPSSFYKVFKHYYDCGKFQYLYEGSKNMIPKKYETLFEEKMKNRFTLINWLDINHWMVLPLIFTKGFGFTVGLFLYNNKTILKIKRTMKK
jgi:glycosyltransferase involved in cell wall biosynthesis